MATFLRNGWQLSPEYALNSSCIGKTASALSTTSPYHANLRYLFLRLYAIVEYSEMAAIMRITHCGSQRGDVRGELFEHYVEGN